MRLQNCQSVSQENMEHVHFPTGLFTILEPRDQEIDEFYVKLRNVVRRILKLQKCEKGRSGKKARRNGLKVFARGVWLCYCLDNKPWPRFSGINVINSCPCSIITFLRTRIFSIPRFTFLFHLPLFFSSIYVRGPAIFFIKLEEPLWDATVFFYSIIPSYF